MSCVATFAYILDAHRDISLEMMVALLMIKNFWAYGSTFFINKWVDASGPEVMFYIIGGIQGFICLGSAVMYIWGKVLREKYARWALLKKLGLYPKKTVDVGGH